MTAASTKVQLWIAMDFVDGTDSQHLLADHYPAGMPADEVATIMTAVAGALAYDHRVCYIEMSSPPTSCSPISTTTATNESF